MCFNCGPDSPLPHLLPTGLLLGIAALFHQQHIFTAIAFAGAFYLLSAGSIAKRLARAAVIGAVSGILTIGVYFWAAFAVGQLESVPEVISWARGHASDGLWTPFSFMSPIKSVLGIISSVYAIDFILASDAVSSVFLSVFPTTVLAEEQFQGGRLSLLSLVIAYSAVAVSAAAGVWLIVRSCIAFSKHGFGTKVGHNSKEDEQRRRAGVLILCYVCVQTLIITVWHPINMEFWIAVLPFLYLLVGMGLSRTSSIQTHALAAVFAAGMTLANLSSTVLPQSDRSNDYWYVQNAGLLEILEPGDLVITEGGYVSNSYVEYFGPPDLTLVTTGRMKMDEVEALISAHEGRIVFSSWAVEPLDFILTSGQLFEWDAEAIAAFDAKYKSHLTALTTSESQKISILTK